MSTADVAPLTGPTPYVVADQAGRAPFAIVQPEPPQSRRASPVGAPDAGHPALGQQRRRPRRDAGGQLRTRRRGGHRLLAVLPDTVAPRADTWRSPARAPPARRDGHARRSVRPVSSTACSTRSCLGRPPVGAGRRATPPPRGLTPAPPPSSPKPCGSPHDRPGEPWSLVSLVRAVGVSRVAFARRFRERVGESPMAYLTRRRMALAADRLRADHRHRGAGGRRGRLPQPVLLQQRLQAGLRPEPVGVPVTRMSPS